MGSAGSLLLGRRSGLRHDSRGGLEHERVEGHAEVRSREISDIARSDDFHSDHVTTSRLAELGTSNSQWEDPDYGDIDPLRGVNSTCCETSDFADFASSRLASNSADLSEASGPSAEILPLSEHQSPEDTTVDIDDGDRILEPSCDDYIVAELASPASTAVRERPPLVTTNRASLLSADEEELMDMILREVGV